MNSSHLIAVVTQAVVRLSLSLSLSSVTFVFISGAAFHAFGNSATWRAGNYCGFVRVRRAHNADFFHRFVFKSQWIFALATPLRRNIRHSLRAVRESHAKRKTRNPNKVPENEHRQKPLLRLDSAYFSSFLVSARASVTRSRWSERDREWKNQKMKRRKSRPHRNKRNMRNPNEWKWVSVLPKIKPN